MNMNTEVKKIKITIALSSQQICPLTLSISSLLEKKDPTTSVQLEQRQSLKKKLLILQEMLLLQST